jgi:hypothetical protein
MNGEDLKKKYEYYFTFNKPIPYKNLFVYPIRMNKYFEFYSTIDCLTIQKNKIPDPIIISMSYLDYLFHLIEKDESGIVSTRLVEILSLALNVEYEQIKYTKENNKITLNINGEIINKKDFDFIRRIICYQNMPDFDDTYIDPEIEEVINETKRLSKIDSNETTSLEYQMACVTASTGLSDEDIEKMTIRKFVLLLGVVDSKLHYQIYKTGECSGMVSFKEPITHWMYYKNNKFNGLLKYNTFKQKMKNVT